MYVITNFIADDAVDYQEKNKNGSNESKVMEMKQSMPFVSVTIFIYAYIGRFRIFQQGGS